MKGLIIRELGHYVNKLKKRESFGFARYGDGEWLTILGYYGQKNSNGCTFTKELSEDLIRGIRKERSYDYSILRIAYRRSRREIKIWLKKQDIKIKWFLGDFLLKAGLDGKLYPLIQQLRERKILYVGPRHCRKVHDDFFPITAFIEPPPIDAHKKKAEIERAIFDVLDKMDIDFIGFSSGLAGKVFIGDVWEYTNGEIPIMDFGSSWDGYYGVKSRSYIRNGRLNFTQLKKQNLMEI
ncbi:hypothetical protein KA005_21515 [bacterium]|nr:hypothetical protein [bacterium]